VSQAAAIFDVDDTILKGASGLFLARLMLFDRGETVSLKEIGNYVKAYMDFLSAKNIDYEKLIESGLARFEGMTRAQVENAAKDLFDKYLSKNIYRGAYKAIKWHKEQGHRVLLITASIKFLVEPLGDYLKVDEIFALRPIFEDFEMTGKARKPYSYEEGKLELAKEYCEQNGIDLKDCYFYSDSISDLPLMAAVGHPVPTNPDRKLLALSLWRNWRIRWFNTVLPQGFEPEF
jgi:HAD superfamily hydrolase (TIGR01490 family)